MNDEDGLGKREFRGTALGESRDTFSGWTYVKAIEQREAFRQAAAPAMTLPKWQPLGPLGISGGQTSGSGPGSRTTVSGRVSSIIVDPDDGQHLLIAAAAGGIWETRDAGSTWKARTDDQRTLAIGVLAFDPRSPEVIYAGTGEGNGYSYLGSGVLKSQDGGTTWKALPGRELDGEGFYDLVVLGEGRLLGALTSGLWLSENDGRTWCRVREPVTWSLSFQRTSGEILAACLDGLQRSEDGKDWSSVELPEVSTQWVRMAVHHSPQGEGEIAYVFAARDEGGGKKAYLWRREPPPDGKFHPIRFPALDAGQADYDWFVAAEPDSASGETLYLGAESLFRGIRLPSGAWRWANISDRINGGSIHLDQHAIAFDPQAPGTLYVGNDGGVFQSRNAGETWRPLNRGLGITEVLFLAQDPRAADRILAGTQDNGTLLFEGSTEWTLVAVGDGGYCGIQQGSPYFYFHGFTRMRIERSGKDGARETWEPIGLDRPEPYRSFFHAPMEVLGEVVVQAGETVLISQDSGNTWTELSLLDGVGRVSAIAIGNSGRILVGTESGDVYRIDVGFGFGQWETPFPVTSPRAGFISSILIDSNDLNRLWVTYSDIPGPGQGQIFRSRSGGGDWEDVSIPNLDVAVNVIRNDPGNSEILYAGTDLGVFRSPDGGDTWEDFNNGLPNVIVGDLAIHGPTRLLRAATVSRGVWETTLP
ncbi:MAG TPA: hypothetical protein VHC97_05395 [Thermoanaerobaculia bacterium]|jgi:photosystem II stability/assembly factor-like uncharacterized protein|nr:hypothetical protein [Thermoanaerobaculia bacterium]